ncbi:MAG: hypothetical protein QXS96_04725 [Candidatus Caldarchaeum sp.]
MKISKQQLITNIIATGLTAAGLSITVYALLQQQQQQPPPPPPSAGAKLSATLSSSSLPEGSTTPLTIDVSYTKQDNNVTTPLPNYELYMKVYNASSKEDVTATVSSTGSQIITARTDSNGKARFTLYVSKLRQGQYAIVISDSVNELGLQQQMMMMMQPPDYLVNGMSVPAL